MAPEKRIEIFDDILEGIALAEADTVVRGVEKPVSSVAIPSRFIPTTSR